MKQNTVRVLSKKGQIVQTKIITDTIRLRQKAIVRRKFVFDVLHAQFYIIKLLSFIPSLSRSHTIYLQTASREDQMKSIRYGPIRESE